MGGAGPVGVIGLGNMGGALAGRLAGSGPVIGHDPDEQRAAAAREEGVEDKATMSLLSDYGCDEVQGFLFSRPVPGDDLLAWLDTSPFGTPRRLEVVPSPGV